MQPSTLLQSHPTVRMPLPDQAFAGRQDRPEEPDYWQAAEDQKLG
jgi:hypothetical protein